MCAHWIDGFGTCQFTARPIQLSTSRHLQQEEYLATRKNHVKNLEEKYQYNSQNRLTEERLGTTLTSASSYDSYGRLTAKTADGQAVFSNAVYNTTAKPHALDTATTAEGVFPTASQSIAYTGFDKVSKVKQGNDSICYTYGKTFCSRLN